MRRRCHSAADPSYARYGGRGIAVCERWSAFEHFLEDMGERPTGSTLDRIDNDGDYAPGNCRWASRKTQCNNRRTNRRVRIGDVTKTVAEWADGSGLARCTVKSRLQRGWPLAKALSTQLHGPPVMYEIDGESRTLPEWARRYGVACGTVYRRVNAGISAADALRTPEKRRA